MSTFDSLAENSFKMSHLYLFVNTLRLFGYGFQTIYQDGFVVRRQECHLSCDSLTDFFKALMIDGEGNRRRKMTDATRYKRS